MRKIGASILTCAITATLVVTPVMGSSADPTAATVTSQTLDVTGISKKALKDESALESAPVEAGLSDESLEAEIPQPSLRAEESSQSLDQDNLAALSAQRETRPFLLAGITWNADDKQQILTADARVLENDEWTDWSALDILPTRPGDERTGTEPLITNGAHGIQVRVLTESGTEPEGLEVALVNPGESDNDAVDQPQTDVPSTANASSADGIKPNVIPREKWMGDGQEKYTTWKSDYSARLDAMYLHHTAGTNNYASDGGAAIVRGVYNYHARTLGWGDIGYQFLVDKYGNIFEGRHDAIEALPVGAQAGGYNSGTIGVSALGNYETAKPTSKLLNSVAQVFAWKAYENGLDPRGTAQLLTGTSSKSSLKASIGSWVTVPTILAHRDTNYTACPGINLYKKMDEIRANVAEIVDAHVDAVGSYKPTLATPKINAVANTVYPVLLSDTVKLSWAAVPGATRYHVMTRLSNKGYALGRDISWTLHKNVTTNSATLTFKEGQTRYVAVRAVNADGHSYPVKISQFTRPNHSGGATKSTGWTKVARTDYYGGSAQQATKAGRTLSYGSAVATRKIAVVGESSPSAGSVDVIVGGKKAGTLDFRASTTNRNAVKVVDLGSVKSGKVELKTSGDGSKWIVSAAALLPQEQSAPELPTPIAALRVRPPAAPKVTTLSSASTPITLAPKVTYTWKPVTGAVRYEFGVKEAAYNKSMPSSIKVKKTVTGSSYRYTIRSGYTTKAYVRAVGANGKKSSWVAFKPVSYAPSGTKLERSKGWKKKKSSKYFRAYTYETATKNKSIKIRKAKSVKRVALTVSKSSGAGRIAIYTGNKKIKTVSLKSKSRTYKSKIYVTLPKAYSGTIMLKTVDNKIVRVSAVTLIK